MKVSKDQLLAQKCLPCGCYCSEGASIPIVYLIGDDIDTLILNLERLKAVYGNAPIGITNYGEDLEIGRGHHEYAIHVVTWENRT